MLQTISMVDVRKNYDDRLQVGKDLHRLLASGKDDLFAELALGISDPKGNYSAAEHGLGERILSQRTPSTIVGLARQLTACTTANQMLDLIRSVNIPWLKVSVGSEMAMLLMPRMFWVANTRTVWAHLLLKHQFSLKRANEELRLYRSGDQDSEMAYRIWQQLYLEIASTVVPLSTLGSQVAASQRVQPGQETNIWFDSIATYLYEQYGG